MSLNKIEKWVKERMKDAEPGHDWSHVLRVKRNALAIIENEDANKEVVELAAVLHDAADSKFFDETKALDEIKRKRSRS